MGTLWGQGQSLLSPTVPKAPPKCMAHEQTLDVDHREIELENAKMIIHTPDS